jgi:quercetin dioxygenase-like cupin family protein
MPRLIAQPVVIQAAGNKPKVIRELVGRPSSGAEHVSVARMSSPAGWEEPAQAPEFEEITIVLAGTVRIDHDGGHLLVGPGQAAITFPGERVRYSTPGAEGAEYLAICLPAFSPHLVHRDDDGGDHR